MRIVVVGAGALGGLIGAQLTEAGEDVIFIERNRARARLLDDDGMYISEAGRTERKVRIHVLDSACDVGPADLVFLAVKSYQTGDAIEETSPVLTPSTLVLSLQNGIGNTRTIADAVGPERVLCGITYHSVQHVGPNRLRYRVGIKPIQIAPYQGRPTSQMQTIAEVFRKADLATEVVDNIDNSIWQKLLHNAVVNPTSALTGLTCRELLDDPDLMDFMRDLTNEIVAVMKARGIPIVDEEDPFRPVTGSLTALGKNRPSMWQDLARGNRTEVEAINGAIVEEGERHGLSTPHNRALVHFIRSRERLKELRRREISNTLQSTTERVTVKPTRMSREGGMVEGRVPLRTAHQLKELLRDYYRDVQAAAEDPDRPVAWCSGMGPVEILRALGITPYFPENHAALIGASRQAGRYIPRALAEGFSQFASSAMTSDIGAMLVGDSPLVSVYGIAGPPDPDLVVYNTNNGRSLARWFEYYGTRFSVPVLGLHPPAALREVSSLEIDASVQQIKHVTARLEEIVGTRLDTTALSRIVDYSAQAARLWGEILELARTVPAPLTFFDLLIHMAPIVLMRGTPEAVAYYTILKAEIEQRVADQQAAVPGERFRLYWEGPPIWCALRPLAELFLEHRTAVVAATYTGIFALEGLDGANPLESMAHAYTRIFPNRSDDYKAGFLASQFRDFAVDAALYHDGRTSPEQSNVRYGLEVRLSRATGLPSIVVEGDTHDLRLISMDQIQTRLADFIDQQESIAEASSSPSVGAGC